jgi:hypothetical protein
MQNVFYFEMKTLQPPATTGPMDYNWSPRRGFGEKAGATTTTKPKEDRRLAEAKAHATLMSMF